MNSSLDTLWVVEPSKDKFWVVIHELQTSWKLPDLKRANIEDMTTKLRTLRPNKRKSNKILAAKRKMSFPSISSYWLKASIPFCRTSPNLLGWCFARKMNSSLESWRLWNWKLNCNMKNGSTVQILQEHGPKHGPKRCVGRFVGTYLRSSNLAALEDADISIVNAIYYLIWYIIS